MYDVLVLISVKLSLLFRLVMVFNSISNDMYQNTKILITFIWKFSFSVFFIIVDI